ncbi:MAG TPA: hypothetical protein VH813_05385 [Candidatus Limnocylindrales bacterium]|jgi:hypothetical protein
MPTTRPRSARLLLVTALAVVAALGAPGAQAAQRGYSLDLSRQGDFVAQTNFVQCVGASMQMMLNVIEPRNDRTAGTQLRLQRLARRLSPPRPDGSERQGASIIGWTEGLNRLGAGPYRLDGTTTIQSALRNAARAIRATRRPVGLLMWHGRHAWVMVGFRATADPARSDDFRVTHAIVMDPLYPHGSSVWGRSPRPGEMLAVATLGRQFVPRRKGHRASIWLAGYEGKYVTTLPYTGTPVVRPAVDPASPQPVAARWSIGHARMGFAL